MPALSAALLEVVASNAFQLPEPASILQIWSAPVSPPLTGLVKGGIDYLINRANLKRMGDTMERAIGQLAPLVDKQTTDEKYSLVHALINRYHPVD